ncbi:ABC transporter, periplasmic substrate-binding protein [Azotobacter vinelandii CA]|uniref:ABC transporter, periplasmic substrate-binding protein n=2 Tax=Azotobacter vinelandii TaxID=354 RepID=C1DN85_AZOVD|nr:ABC transporter substrate-binding protein [Azotobacter vinelandii]ACO79252.1 ABC transporter, periplasmic substrate-binding protein [Azotobacter vinelandii DJ]AGK16463.1 ABC transporter, periplasmic substrate-binding protein [Azotobacter vinelandii CA]AGK21062.1 ABC transporter, periplasmic substrate-binding protein [Azotobacter vinelandii CA6]SFY28040.1 NitT/TauT family transport system substrate-binding protein [Azotobacter vinelandii]GLK61874.1 ABC transporter substrate-binding protein [
MQKKTHFRPARLAAGVLAGLLGSVSLLARAEGEISIAQQFGIGYLLLDVVRDQKLIEKHGKEQGIDIQVEWRSISGATAMNEALLAGALDVVSAGVPPMLTMWDRTRGRQNVKAIAALGSLPNYLLSNNPAVKSLDDLGEKDRIAVPAAGVGFQSRTLQIEAAKRYGKERFKRFDDISVSLPHPDATAALTSGGSEVTAHFSSAPFYYQALESPKVRKLISSYDILGGPATFNVLYTTEKFHKDNPKTYRAFYAALAEAERIVKADKPAAAQTYIRVENSKLAPELVEKIVEDEENDFTIVPQRTFIYAEKLHELGVLKNKAASWKDYFFEEAHDAEGS